MLKVIYSETGQHLEHISSAELQWLRRQQQLENHVGQTLVVDACTATILLPATHDVIAELEWMMHQHSTPLVDWAVADADTIEVILSGLWASSCAQGHEGTFLAAVDDRVAMTLIRLWADAVTHVPTVSR